MDFYIFLNLSEYCLDISSSYLDNSFKSDSKITRWWNERDLVSSYILFDRNGIFEKMQDELGVSTKPWGGLSRIGNIDELNVESSKKKVLSNSD